MRYVRPTTPASQRCFGRDKLGVYVMDERSTCGNKSKVSMTMHRLYERLGRAISNNMWRQIKQYPS